ncbi:arylformamidase [Lederbergia citrea]|uniref:Kynurenine formamidase n=1 Tax=Lederbergia citrea TaxID=2833581 RepID=A0A942UMP0_9BACI|nr:arylformamidase [Lederbergia citrea]MBS4224256.1 arylformamidase [Lederbergia citrea]
MSERKWIDISQPLSNEIAVWPGDTPFSFELSFTKEQTGSVNIGSMTTSVHTGTHIDAPFHFDDEGKKVHELDLDLYIGHARVVDVTGYKIIGREELESLQLDGVERLLLRMTNRRNPNEFPKQFTHLRADIGPFLQEKGVRLLGVDSPSVDPVDSKVMSAHHSLNDNGVFILENIVLEGVEPGDYELIALPLAIHGADGSPVRAVIKPL